MPVLYYLLTLEPKIDVNPVDVTGGTPLDDAIRHQQQVCETMLRNAGGLTKDDPKLLETQQQRELSKKEQDRKIRWNQIQAAADTCKEVGFFSKFDTIMQTYHNDDAELGDVDEDLGYIENEEEFVEELVDKSNDAEASTFQERLKRFHDFFVTFTSTLQDNASFLSGNACSDEYLARLQSGSDSGSDNIEAYPDIAGKPPKAGATASMSFCGRLRADSTLDAQVGSGARFDFDKEGEELLTFTQRLLLTFTQHVNQVAASGDMRVELFDYESIGQDRTMGSFAIPVSQIALNTQMTFQLTGDLAENKGPAQGAVYMSFVFTPSLLTHTHSPGKETEVGTATPSQFQQPSPQSTLSDRPSQRKLRQLRALESSSRESLPGRGRSSSPASPHLVPSSPGETAELDGLREVVTLAQQLPLHLAALRKTVCMPQES